MAGRCASEFQDFFWTAIFNQLGTLQIFGAETRPLVPRRPMLDVVCRYENISTRIVERVLI